MTRLNIRLSDVHTRTELAKKLNVDVKALNLVTLSSTPCRYDDCSLPAAENNYKCCILDSQSWFPRLTNIDGKKSKYSRGHGLYGPKFMRQYKGYSRPTSCCCDAPLYEQIGYSHEGMMTFPTDTTQCKEAIRLLGIRFPFDPWVWG